MDGVSNQDPAPHTRRRTHSVVHNPSESSDEGDAADTVRPSSAESSWADTIESLNATRTALQNTDHQIMPPRRSSLEHAGEDAVANRASIGSILSVCKMLRYLVPLQPPTSPIVCSLYVGDQRAYRGIRANTVMWFTRQSVFEISIRAGHFRDVEGGTLKMNQGVKRCSEPVSFLSLPLRQQVGRGPLEICRAPQRIPARLRTSLATSLH